MNLLITNKFKDTFFSKRIFYFFYQLISNLMLELFIEVIVLNSKLFCIFFPCIIFELLLMPGIGFLVYLKLLIFSLELSLFLDEFLGGEIFF